MGLDVGQDVRDVAVVFSAVGHVDSMTVDTFHSSLEGALEGVARSHPAKKLVIELADVTTSEAQVRTRDAGGTTVHMHARIV